jgi:dethiobiotin synthetase
VTARIVVLGTGTGVGKTYVTIALLQSLARASISVAAVKPIESGYDPPIADATRLASITAACAKPHVADAAREALVAVSTPLYALPEPLSPHLAAARAGTRIDLQRLRNWITPLDSHFDYVLLESAGGAFSPLCTEARDRATFNADLPTAVDAAAVVVVAPDALGCLHATIATLMALHARGVARPYVVLTQATGPDASTGTNGAAMTDLGINYCGTVRRNGPADVDDLARRLLATRDAGSTPA